MFSIIDVPIYIPKCLFTDEWIKNVIAHTYMCMCVHTEEYKSALKKEKILPFVTKWMNLMTLAQWNKLDAERQILHGIKNVKFIEKENRMVVIREWDMGDAGPGIHSFSYAI